MLEIGGGPKPKAHLVWKDAEIVALDADEQYSPDILMDAINLPFAEEYDAILASHVLEHFPWFQIKDVLLSWTKALKKGGRLYIIVPSLEWACRHSREHPFTILPHLFGGQTTPWDIHKSMFTADLLRNSLISVGLTVEQADTRSYTYLCLGKEVKAEEHHIIGRK